MFKRKIRNAAPRHETWLKMPCWEIGREKSPTHGRIWTHDLMSFCSQGVCSAAVLQSLTFWNNLPLKAFRLKSTFSLCVTLSWKIISCSRPNPEKSFLSFEGQDFISLMTVDYNFFSQIFLDFDIFPNSCHSLHGCTLWKNLIWDEFFHFSVTWVGTICSIP